MEKKTLLIAETNKPQDELIKKALLKNNIEIEILDRVTKNSEEMKTAILELNPDIVITNEVKKDKPATDIIQEIQTNQKIKQPVFIITTAYSEMEMKQILAMKNIVAYIMLKPYDFNELANNVDNIIKTLFS